MTSAQALERAVGEVAAAWATMRPRAEREQLGMKAVWQEVAACILGSQVRYEAAQNAAERLEKVGLLPPYSSTDHPSTLKLGISAVLRQRTSLGGSESPAFRFPERGADLLVRASHSGRKIVDGLIALQGSRQAGRHLRVELVTHVAGLGPKQASLLLRSVVGDESLAVLDSHVMNYLRCIGISNVSTSRLSRLTVYEEVEAAFLRYSWRTGYSPAVLDVAVWVVMRAARRERRQWLS